MKKETLIALAVAFALSLVFEGWHIYTTLQNRTKIKELEAKFDKADYHIERGGTTLEASSRDYQRVIPIDRNAPDTFRPENSDAKFATQ